MELEPIRQAGVIAAEAMVVAWLLLTMFHFRKSLGLAPLHATLGVFYQLAALMSGTIFVQFSDDLLMSPASVALCPASLFAVLLIYIREDWPEARRAIYALIAANLVVGLLCFMVAQHLASSIALNPLGMPAEFFEQQPRLLLLASAAIFADAVLIILAYDFLGRFIRRSLFSRIYLAMALVMTFDTLLFVAGGFHDSPHLRSLFLSGLIGKLVVGGLYAAALTIYLRYLDVNEGCEIPASDLLPSLTYREKYERLHETSMRDPLTGLYHRGLFDAMLASQHALAMRSRTPMSLLVVDVDHFKKINDTFGHREGDQVLKCVADTLQSSVRASDFACRFGGEEFVVLLTATAAEEAEVVAERMRLAVTVNCDERTAAGKSRPVTVSIGIAAAREAASPGDLLELADRRLYDAKHAGRNRVHARCEPDRAVAIAKEETREAPAQLSALAA
jgi:diguanylate cyclase (GGDEF)-like protein